MHTAGFPDVQVCQSRNMQHIHESLVVTLRLHHAHMHDVHIDHVKERFSKGRSSINSRWDD